MVERVAPSHRCKHLDRQLLTDDGLSNLKHCKNNQTLNMSPFFFGQYLTKSRISASRDMVKQMSLSVGTNLTGTWISILWRQRVTVPVLKWKRKGRRLVVWYLEAVTHSPSPLESRTSPGGVKYQASQLVPVSLCHKAPSKYTCWWFCHWVTFLYRHLHHLLLEENPIVKCIIINEEELRSKIQISEGKLEPWNHSSDVC